MKNTVKPSRCTFYSRKMVTDGLLNLTFLIHVSLTITVYFLLKKKCFCTKRFALSLCRALSFTWPAATVLCASFFKHYRNRKYINFPHHCQTILFHLASVNWSSHPFIGSSPSLMMALFLMCLIGFSGTALLAFKKSRDKPLGYTVLATGDHERKKHSLYIYWTWRDL